MKTLFLLLPHQSATFAKAMALAALTTTLAGAGEAVVQGQGLVHRSGVISLGGGVSLSVNGSTVVQQSGAGGSVSVISNGGRGVAVVSQGEFGSWTVHPIDQVWREKQEELLKLVPAENTKKAQRLIEELQELTRVPQATLDRRLGPWPHLPASVEFDVPAVAGIQLSF